MEPIKTPQTLKFYQLIKMSTNGGFNLCGVGTLSTGVNYVGSGFYTTLAEAEHNRTLETLKDKDGAKFYVFELEFPNPVYKE